MSDFILSCCSTVDLSKESFRKMDVHYIPFHFYVNDKHYYDDMGNTMPLDEFYDLMKKGAMTRTSQVNSTEFVEYFTPFLEAGKDILHISMSSGISGVYNSAVMAKNELQQKYPDRKIYIVDSLSSSNGGALILDKLVELRDKKGYSVDQLYDWTEKNKLKVHHWFIVTDLKYLVRGGRISKASGFIGGLLNICPIMTVDKFGKLIPIKKVRSRTKAINELVNKMVELADNSLEYDEKCYVSHAAMLGDAIEILRLIKDKFKSLSKEIEINSIGPTIGSHTGPGTMSLFFWGPER